MLRETRRTDSTGSALTRLLARLGDLDAPQPDQALADRLSHWLDWTGAISLASALDGPPPSAATRVVGARAASADCERVRTALTSTIAAVNVPNAGFAEIRHRYATWQHTAVAAIVPLRARLRAALSAASPASERLAAVDAVMEQTLATRERNLLATVPGLIEKRFAQLRDAPDESGVATSDRSQQFGSDLQAVLRAELALRFEPIDGLLEALRVI